MPTLSALPLGDRVVTATSEEPANATVTEKEEGEEPLTLALSPQSRGEGT